MAEDFFDLNVAYDPATQQLVTGASFDVYAVDDLAFTTPLAVFEASSGVGLSSLMSSNVGVLPQFRVAGDPEEIILRSGTFVTRLRSVDGSRGPAGKSAYEFASEAGYNGTEEEFGDSMALIGRTIAETAIVGGHLIITTSAGEELDVGEVKGEDGDAGVGIASMTASGGNLLITLTNGSVVDVGALPAGPAVSPAGSTAGQVFTSAGPSSAPGWQTPSPGISGAPSSWPTSFPPAAHLTDLSTLRTGSTALASAVLTMLAATDAAAARTAISAAAANHSHAASTVAFTPTSEIPGTTVQQAIEQAASLGGSGVANTVTLSGASTERKHPVTGVTLPLPPACVVQWIAATTPTHIVPGDTWVTTA